MAAQLKDLLSSLIQPENSWKTNLLSKWRDIVGPLHTKVRVEKIYDDAIILGVFHSCWMQELYLLSPLLLKTINEKLDQPYIKQIRFKHIGAQKTFTKKTTLHMPIKKNIQLTSKDERTLAKISDPALREAIKAFRIRCYQES